MKNQQRRSGTFNLADNYDFSVTHISALFMNSISISSKKWRTFDLEEQIKFLNTQLQKSHHKVTAFPSPELLVILRRLNCATLEVLEILQLATVYRIKPTGQTYLVLPDGQTTIFASYQDYIIQHPGQLNNTRIILDSKDPVYTINFKGYIPVITRHKPPRFSGAIRKQPTHLDTGPEWQIDIDDITWPDGPQYLSDATYAALMKKTVLFIIGNTNLLDEQAG